MNAFDFEAVHRKEIAEQYTIFVYRLGRDGRNPPVRDQQLIPSRDIVLAFGRVDLCDPRENPQHRIRIADVEN